MSKENLYVFQELKSGVKNGFVTHIDQVRGADMLGQMVNITYSELLLLTRNNNLIPGRQYRITDFVTTCNDAGSVDGITTRSAGNPFDIIVIADSTDTLNENARALIHDGDTYFAGSNLAAWQLKYSIDNDTSRFAWAVPESEGGKGVIYYMKDEFNNECFYDFKNIQYLRENVYYYTFSIPLINIYTYITDKTFDWSITLEGSSRLKCVNNTISSYRETATDKLILNNIIFSIDAIFEDMLAYSTFICFNNNIEEDCRSMYLPNPTNTHIGKNCYGIEIYDSFHNSNIGFNCYNIKNVYSIEYSTIGDNCHVLFENFGRCEYITVGNDCSGIKTIDNYSPTLQRCVFGKNCRNITLSGNNSNQYWNDYFFEDNTGVKAGETLTITNPETTTSVGQYKFYKTKIATNSAGEVKIYCEADLITNIPVIQYIANESSMPETPTEGVLYLIGEEPTLISFTIGTTSYQAEEGMSWGEWVESDYNTYGLKIIDDYIWTESGSNTIVKEAYDSSSKVTANEMIESNFTYYQFASGGSSD